MDYTPLESDSQSAGSSPFSLRAMAEYETWRTAKLTDYPHSAAALCVAVADAANPSTVEIAALSGILQKTNMALYASDPATTREAVRTFGRHFGLNQLDHNLGADDDGLTAIQVENDGSKTRYIPYTDRPISWHTDGYYNEPARQIRGMVLHCARTAASGGENALMDNDIAYILLRDANPAFIEAFQHPQAMTIPANEDANGAVRPAETGPVFSLNPDGSLYMRYTARTRNIEWRDDPATRDAVACLSDILASDSPYIFRHRMAPGEGLICNNVLHNRTAFENESEDGEGRLLFRGRYLDRIAGTGLTDF